MTYTNPNLNHPEPYSVLMQLTQPTQHLDNYTNKIPMYERAIAKSELKNKENPKLIDNSNKEDQPKLSTIQELLSTVCTEAINYFTDNYELQRFAGYIKNYVIFEGLNAAMSPDAMDESLAEAKRFFKIIHEEAKKKEENKHD